MKEENSKISEHIHRTGYHFREVIVDEAREIVGETVVVSQPALRSGKVYIEPIPESQEEINKQADAAIRDLFPRIPNIDRTMIIEHAFKKVSFQTMVPFYSHFPFAYFSRVLCFMVSQRSDCRPTSPCLVEYSSLFSLISDIPIQDTINCSGRRPG
jgi:hypothetical protein